MTKNQKTFFNIINYDFLTFYIVLTINHEILFTLCELQNLTIHLSTKFKTKSPIDAITLCKILKQILYNLNIGCRKKKKRLTKKAQ